MTHGVIHVAGPAIIMQDRWLRQRCSWCGALLLDHDLTRTSSPLKWTVSHWILVEDGAGMDVTGSLARDASGRLPPNLCMALDPEVTR